MNNVYQECDDLLARYPLAAEPLAADGSQTAMTVMVIGDDGPEFFILRHVSNGDPHPFWVIHPWGAEGNVAVEPGDSVKAMPPGACKSGRLSLGEARHVVVEAVPLPRDGALFGWAPEGTVTALVPFDGEARDDHPVPTWALMPLAGTAEAQWPDFADKRPLGEWFWEYHRAGLIVELDEAIAQTRRACWWLNGEVYGLDTGLCAVARDIAITGGLTLPRGLYACCGVLREGTPLPTLEDVLAGRGKTDLGPRFREAA
jgi:hypothetical protein